MILVLMKRIRYLALLIDTLPREVFLDARRRMIEQGSARAGDGYNARFSMY